MTTDVSTFIGAYPFRSLDTPTPEWLLGQMDRLGIDDAWVGHLPSAFYRDPAPGTAVLLRELAPHRDRLHPVPTVNPDLPRWEDDLNLASVIGAPAVRVYPTVQGVEPAGGTMRVLVAAAALVRMPLLFTVRFEDGRQRHPRDTAPEVPPSAIRTLIRLDPDARFLITHADRDFVEEVHFGLTAAEADRLLWDVTWIWGPPEDHLRLLLQTVGPQRFALGTGMPLRIPDAALAKLDLLDVSDAERADLTRQNLARWRSA